MRWPFVVMLLVATACSSGDEPPLVRAVVTTTSTSTAIAPTSSSSPPLSFTTTPSTPTTVAAAPTPPAGGVPGAVITPKGIVVPVLSREGANVKVRTPCGREAVVAGGRPVSAAVVIDPGHGGAEPGAVGPNRLKESTLNQAVSEYAAGALRAAGVDVALTRTAEYEVSLAVRSEIATLLRPRAFVSVHHNSSPDGPRAGPGSETYYQIASPESKRLAGILYEEIVRALSQYQVAWVADTDAGAKYRRGDNGDYYSILRRSAGVTTSLAELAFISNPPEADLLARTDVQRVEGEAVARGIIRFLTTNDAGSGYVEPYPRPSEPGGGGGGRACVDPAL